MSFDTDDRVFTLLWPAIFGVSGILSGLLSGDGPHLPLVALSAVLLTVSGGIYAATRYATRREGHLNVGPPYVHKHPRLLKAYLLLTGLKVAGCGCIYATGSLCRHAHKPGHEVVESEEYWLEEYDGARVHYRLYEEQTVRCEACGRHRIEHKRVKRWFSEERTTHTAWRDDIDRAPEDGRPIKEPVEVGRA